MSGGPGLSTSCRPPGQPPCPAPPRPAQLTFLTVLAFVAGGADAVAINAGAVAPAGGVDALIHGHVALGPFPAAVALAGPFRVLSVPAAQDGAGGCESRDRASGHGDQRPKGWVGPRRQSLPGVSAEPAMSQARGAEPPPTNQ